LAAKLAQAIYDDVATPLFRARDRAAQVFRGLRITPTMTVDAMTGGLSFSFSAAAPAADIDATLERLFELPAELAGERKRHVAIVFDEFQEVTTLDPQLPRLMRAVFQTQPEVAHVYLGSKRALMERLFNDVNEPFWRSARQLELGPIPRAEFARFIESRFAVSGGSIDADAVQAILDTTGGHPYGTQELCYAVWEVVAGGAADTAAVDIALTRVLQSENAHFSLIWERAPRVQRLVLEALARDPSGSVTSTEYRNRHGLPTGSSVQRALDTLVDDELVTRVRRGDYRIAEPFLAQWIRANAV
jgi:hypothetical protein